MDAELLQAELNQFRNDFQQLRDEIGKVVVGQSEIVQQSLIALIAGGHVLLEGVPGLGKTLLVRTLANTLQSQFARIQFTPDLMPADMIGTNVMVETDQGGREFRFQKGPVFANIVLADEINRATPKTQSALLEAMQERSVTVGGVTHELPQLFFVMATQNPLEMEGTYPLPEAQLDRFFCKLVVEFPNSDELESILDRTTEAVAPNTTGVMNAERLGEMSQLARQIPIADEIRREAIGILLATHPDKPESSELTRKYVRFGASPRGAQSLILGSKIHAILNDRCYVSREDLQAIAPHVLRHRLILNFEGQAESIRTDDILSEILNERRESQV